MQNRCLCLGNALLSPAVAWRVSCQRARASLGSGVQKLVLPMLKPPAFAASAAACCLLLVQLKRGIGITSYHSLDVALNLLHHQSADGGVPSQPVHCE